MNESLEWMIKLLNSLFYWLIDLLHKESLYSYKTNTYDLNMLYNWDSEQNNLVEKYTVVRHKFSHNVLLSVRDCWD